MGALAARCADSAVPGVSLRRAGPLPADRGCGGQHRRPGRCAGPVPGVHARRHRPALGRCNSAVGAPAPCVLRCCVVRRARHDLAPGGVRHLRRDVGVPGRAGGVVRDPCRGPGTGDRVDDRGGGCPGAGQRHGLHPLLFDPLIAALALLTAPWTARGLLAAWRAGTVLAATAVLLAAGLGPAGAATGVVSSGRC